MATAEKFRKLCEKAGMCWHEWKELSEFSMTDVCQKCGITKAITVPRDNPSHTDLNAVVELAKKLGFYTLVFDEGTLNISDGKGRHAVVLYNPWHDKDAEAEALTLALWSAEGEK